MTINELLWLDSTGHTSLTSRVQLSLFCPSGAFQRRRIMPACYCCLALIVFIWSFFLDFCASSMDEQFEWLNCFLVVCFVWFLLPFLTSLSYISQVDTGSFILKTDRMVYDVPVSDFLLAPPALCSFTWLLSASFKNRLAAYCLWSSAERHFMHFHMHLGAPGRTTSIVWSSSGSCVVAKM